MEELNFSLGVKEFQVNGGRVIRFNPADIGFADTVFTLGGKLDAIRAGRDHKAEKSNDPSKTFDYDCLCEKRMREAMDAVFGEGFCEEVFQEVRLTALSDGMMLYEVFLCTIVDQVADSTIESLSRRNARVAAYTARYQEKSRKLRNVVSME